MTAAFVSGLSARAEAAELGANFSARLAEALESARASNQSLSSGNLTNLLAQLYTCGLLPARCIYTFLEHLRKRFEEQDTVLMHALLKSCGLRLRSDDPVAMKVCSLLWSLSTDHAKPGPSHCIYKHLGPPYLKATAHSKRIKGCLQGVDGWKDTLLEAIKCRLHLHSATLYETVACHCSRSDTAFIRSIFSHGICSMTKCRTWY